MKNILRSAEHLVVATVFAIVGILLIGTLPNIFTFAIGLVASCFALSEAWVSVASLFGYRP